MVSQINTGKTHRQKGLSYPIHHFNSRGGRNILQDNQIDKIIKLLQTTTLSYKKIGEHRKENKRNS